jgi:tetratricopeptide (TPR) repeat protein
MLARGIIGGGLLMVMVWGLQSVAAAPTTRPEHAYFPVLAGTTWKYRVITTIDGKAGRPIVQTLTAGDAPPIGGQPAFAIDGEIYQIKADGVFVAGHLENGLIKPLADAQKVLPVKPRTGEAWSSAGKAESSYSTCLGSQPIKTQAAEYTTQCVYITGGVDGTVQRQTYRYFARGVGLVRETVNEKTKLADGSTVVKELSRELIAFTPVVESVIPVASKPVIAIGAESVRGELFDAAGQPIAQAPLTIRRLDKPGAQQIQTDVSGRFYADGLDPTGSYVLAAQLTGYEASETLLNSTDRKTVLAEVQLKESAIEKPTTSESAFAAGKRLAAAGDHRAALARFAEAAKADPKDGTILAYRAISQLALGQLSEAQQSIDEALRLNDKDALIWEVAGQLKVAQGQLNQARALFDKAAQLSPKTAGAIYVDLAAALAAKNDSKLAGEIDSALKAGAAAEPPSAEALFQLGQSYANAGKQQGATYLKKYIEIAKALPAAEQDKQKIQVAKQLIGALDALKQLK